MLETGRNNGFKMVILIRLGK